jgi:8-hydroxy-5-deazaflavin:NADPH oxidoreductase
MNIAILGPGNMGIALATMWARRGHHISFSLSNNPAKMRQVLELVDNAAFLPLAAAVTEADVVVLCLQYDGLDDIYEHKERFEGKLVITCMNDLKPDLSGNTIGLKTGRTLSVAEEIQALITNAFVVEAFTTVFAVNIRSLKRARSKEKGTVFYCTDHADKVPVVEKLIDDLGYRATNAGKLKNARTLETLGTIWYQLAVISSAYPDHELQIVKH